VLSVRIVICATLAGSAPALVLASPPPAGAAVWSIQPTPDPAGGSDSVLSAVSCATSRLCIAVGYFTNVAGAGVTLAERWTGSSWRIEPTANVTGATSSLLFGVSCPSARSCVAVGSVTDIAGVTRPLAERWNGAAWSIQRTPSPARGGGAGASYLAGVSCTSRTACTAVGYSGNSVGTRGATLAERWNGTRWTIERPAEPAGTRVSFISGVSCASPRLCTAVGYLTTRAGLGVTLAEQWDGTGWSIERTATPEGATTVQLAGISCPSPNACTDVGFFSNISGIDVMLAERWGGGSWVIQRTLYPAGARYVQFLGVSCASAVSCTAAGLFNNPAGSNDVLVERWNGARWLIQRAPHPSGASDDSLDGVSCPSNVRCTAVGSFTNGAGNQVTLAERYG